ncbi:MAG: FecR family protein, partial [Nitrospiraceae bacterium]
MALKPYIVTLAVVIPFSLAGTGVFAQAPLADAIGQFTAIQGHVTVAHPNAAGTVRVKLDDDVLFHDIIETQRRSRTKALFEDDSLLTVGENSRIEITEHVYDPNQNLRSSVVNLVQGRLRALVGKVFMGAGSKFEVRTPTAVVAARGTYFVVWLDGDVSGIVNIGTRGDVEFTSGGQTISVQPGQFSTARAGLPPSPPASAAENAPPNVRQAIEGTALRDTLR